MAAPTLVATAKSATANSYLTRAEAQTYADESHDGTVIWESKSDAERDRALISATARLEQKRWRGYLTDTATPQALSWPRIGTYDNNNELLDQDVVPYIVKRAAFELALALLKGDLELKDSGLEGFTNVKVGSIDVTPRHSRAAGALPRQVTRLIAPVVWPTGHRAIRT